MRLLWGMIVPLLGGVIFLDTQTEKREWVNPEIKGEGKVVVLSGAAVQPKPGSKVVFDIKTARDAQEIVSGLVHVARWVNLNAAANVKPQDIKITAVFHGDATRAVLKHAAYSRHTAVAKNPNLDLIRELKARGVELYVCGQALAHHKYPTNEVTPELAIATAALTVNIQKQEQGYAYLPY